MIPRFPALTAADRAVLAAGQRNEHGRASNDAMAIAIRAHGEILEILREAGF